MGNFLRYMSHTFGVIFGFSFGIAMLKDPTIPAHPTVEHLEWWMPLFFLTYGFIALTGWWHEFKKTL